MEHPLLANPPTTVPNSRPPPAKSSNPNILVGLTIFLVVAAFSLLANYEAAKGFQIVVVNAALQTHAGRRFDLLFVSNGRATRLVVASSNLVQRILYPDDSFPRKPVDRVTLYMAGEDLDSTVAVRGGRSAGEFVVRMSPAVMEAADVKAAVAAAVQRGIARVWLWDGRGEAPRSLLDAMAEYVAMSSGMASPSIRPGNTSVSPFNASCWEDDDHVRLASFLHYCDAKHHGFVARLNKAMQEEWTEDTFNVTLGSSVPQICSAYLSAQQISSVVVCPQRLCFHLVGGSVAIHGTSITMVGLRALGASIWICGISVVSLLLSVVNIERAKDANRVATRRSVTLLGSRRYSVLPVS